MANGTPLGNMIVKLELDSSSFGDSLASANRATRYFTNEVKAMDNIMKLTGKSTDGLKSKQESLRNALKSQQNVVSTLKKELENAKPGSVQYETLANKVQVANTKLAALGEQFKNTAKEAALSQSKLNSFGDGAIKFGNKMDQIGDSMRPLSTVLTGAFTLSTRKAMDFEGQMNTIKSLLADTIPTAEGLGAASEKMGEKSKGWAKQYGISTTAINHGMEELIKKGFDMNQTIDAMPALLDASKASGDEFGIVMDSASSILQQFGMKAKDTGRVTDTLTFVANKTSSGFSDLGEAMKYVGPVAKTTGNTLEDTAAAIGILSDNGILGTAAGTALRASMLKLSQVSTKKAVEQFSNLMDVAGKGAQPLAKAWEESIPIIQRAKDRYTEVINLGGTKKEIKDAADGITASYTGVKKAFEKLPFAEQITSLQGMKKEWIASGHSAQDFNGIIKTMVGTESFTAMSVLIDKGGDAIKNLSKETSGATGYTKNLADELSKSSKNGVDKFRASLEVLQITVGQKLLPVLTPAVEWLNKLIDKFTKLPEGAQRAGLAIAGVAALGYPAFNFLGGLSKAIGETSKAFADMRASATAMKLTKELTSVSGGASAASAALSGGGSVAGGASLVAGLGAVAVPAAIATAAIVAIGVAAYAGAKAYEAHQLAGDKWGTEVTKEQDKVITKSYELGNKAKADVAAYADGVKGAEKDVVESNKKIVDSIQTTIDKENERRVEAAKGIEDPEARKKAEDYAAYKLKLDQKTVDSAKKTVENINEIMSDASQNNRKLSTEEKNFIAENYRQLSDAQLKAAGFDKNQRIAIESAYQKDLSKLSDKQLQDRATNVMKGLDKEKTWYDKQKSYLKEVYGEGTESYKREMSTLSDTNHKNTETMILGLARLTQAQGFSLENMSGAWEKYGWTTEEVANLVKNSTEGSTKDAENLGKILKTMDREWDSIKLDPKTGKLTVEGKEVLVQSLLETNKWKDLSLDEKKLLVNGDEARIQFLDTMYVSKEWQNLTPEEKLLLVNGDEAKVKFYDAHSDTEKWNQYQILTKEIGIENRSAIQAIIESDKGIEKWNALNPDEKNLLAKNDGLLKNVLSSETALNGWRALPVEKKELLADSGNLYSVLMRSEEELKKWQNIPDSVKKIIGDNTSYIQTDSEAKAALSVWENTPDPIKKILGDNANVMMAIVSSKENLEIWNRMPEEDKKLLGDNKNFLSSKEGATAELRKWANDNPPPKSLDAIDNTPTPVANAKATIKTLSGRTITLDADDQTQFGVNSALGWLAKLPTYRGISIGIERVGGGEQFAGLLNEKGTNFHPGGDMIVNDQKGAMYKELVQFPGQVPFVPQGRNVYIPNAPVGTKVITASKTKQLMERAGIPKYAKGVGPQRIPLNSKMFRDIAKAKIVMNKTTIFQQNTDGSALKALADALKNLKQQEVVQKIVIENVTWAGKEDISKLLEQLANQEIINARGAFG